MKCVDSNTVSAPNRRPACGTHIDGEVVFIPESTSAVRRCHCSALSPQPRPVVSRSTVENTQIHLREAVNHLVPLTYAHKKKMALQYWKFSSNAPSTIGSVLFENRLGEFLSGRVGCFYVLRRRLRTVTGI